MNTIYNTTTSLFGAGRPYYPARAQAAAQGFKIAQNDKKDTRGPAIRLTKIEAKDGKIHIEGYTTDSQSRIKSVTYRENSGEKKEVAPVDGKFDSNSEQFAFEFPLTDKNGNLFLQITDEFDNVSELKIVLTPVRNNEIFYVTYMSPPALDIKDDNFDNFTVYSTPDTDPLAAKKTKEKLTALKNIADEYLGMKNYAQIPVLIYNPQNPDRATFNQYRGTIENNIFTFPLPVKSPADFTNSNYTIDDWIPHELGDHTVRNYFANYKSNFNSPRWLSEGIGDLLKFLYQKKFYPQVANACAYGSRVKLSDAVNTNYNINLIDGQWDSKHYLCSAAFVAEIVQRHGTGAFKKLFAELDKYPKEERSQDLAIQLLSEITGEDIRAIITNYSTDKAIRVLENVE